MPAEAVQFFSTNNFIWGNIFMKTGRSLSVLLVAFALLLSFSVCGFAAGEGDLLISDADGLWAFAKEVNENQNSYEGKVVKLTADIDLANVPWTPVGSNSASFKGTFDGQGYAITGMYVDAPFNNRAGFFGLIEKAVIKNIIVSGDIKASANNTGMIVGNVSWNSGSKIENCKAIGSILNVTEGNEDNVGICIGGIIGNSQTGKTKIYIVNCISEVNITANNLICGGVVGISSNTQISNSYSTGQIKIKTPAGAWFAGYGGIIGYADDGVDVKNCVSSVNLDTLTEYVGGIVGNGNIKVSIFNCVSFSDVRGKNNLGGILGYQAKADNCVIKNCINMGKVASVTTGGYSDVGAISGNNSGTITNCGWLNGVVAKAVGGYNSNQGTDVSDFNDLSSVVCAYTVDPASISFNREAGAANPIFRTWPGNNPAAVSEWETNVVSGVTLKQDTNPNTIISATKKGVFNVGASLILTATKFGKSDVVPLRLAGDTADTSSNPLLAPALSAVVRVTSDITRVKSIKITNAPQSLKEGEAFNLSCEVLPEDATNKDLVWSSSNNKVAAVTGQSGEITALLAGETVITVEARDGSGIRDQFTLTVKKDYLSNPKPERPAVKTDTAALSKPEYYGESEIEELAKAISMDKSLLTAKEDGSVILRQDVVGVALESVKKENPGLYYESVMPVPLIKAACGSAESGRIIAFGFTVSGDNFGKADSARDIMVMKVLPDGRGVLFKAIGEEREIEDRSCALYKGGEIYSGPVMPEDNYLLTLFIKDGGEFDLDGAENGSVIDPLVVLKAKEAPARESSSGGGCSAGFGGAALLAFAALPVLLRGRRRR